MINSHKMAMIAGAAYPEKDFPSFEAQGFADIQFFEKDGTHCYVMQGLYFNIVVFRGTDEAHDWLTNIDVKKVRSAYGKVHKGFSDSVDHVWEDVLEAVLDIDDKPFIIVGHSKGAAEATILTERLNMATKVKVIETHLFGSPRVGNYKFARDYDKYNLGKTFRYVNNNDIVCRVPSWFRFCHVGTRVYLNSAGKEVGYVGGLKLTFDRIKGRLTGGNLLDGLADHDIHNYCEILK